MRRTIGLLLVLLAAFGLWWKRDEATEFGRRVPILGAFLGESHHPKPAANVANERPRTAASVPVVLATAEKRPLPITIDAIGTVQAVASVAIKPRIDSQIDTVKVSEGARVAEGDLLFTLDSRSLKAQLAQADAQLEKDKAQLEQGQRDLARAEDLLAKRISTEVQRDTAKTGVKVIQAQIAADEAQRANLAALLSYTEIRSPISGRIGSITLKAGTTVRAADSQAIATVNQLDPIYVSFSVPQALFPELRKALAAGEVKVNARYGDATAVGTIAFVENAVDLATGTVLAKALVPNADEKLWPGTFVAVQVVLGMEAQAIAVPSSAVQIGQQGPYLFVVGDDRIAHLRKVAVARTVGAQSVISSGLDGGERIVVDGQLRLVDGAAVQIQGEGMARTLPGDTTGEPERAPRRG